MSFSGEAAVESRVPQLCAMAGERVTGAAANQSVAFCPLSDVYKSRITGTGRFISASFSGSALTCCLPCTCFSLLGD